MVNENLLLKMNGETLARLILRHNKFLSFNAPAPILSRELKMILKFLCKAVDAVNDVLYSPKIDVVNCPTSDGFTVQNEGEAPLCFP